MSEWEKVETAPKDGTKILIYSGRYEFEIVRWLENGTYGEPGWFNSEGDHEYKFDDETFWTPLPSPPVKQHKCNMYGVTCTRNHGLMCMSVKSGDVEIHGIGVNHCPICGEEN